MVLPPLRAGNASEEIAILQSRVYFPGTMIAETERFFLFTDIEGSTRLWEHHPIAMRQALARHDAILRNAALENAGDVFKTIGDAFCIAFLTAEDALRAAVSAQIHLSKEAWGEIGQLKVRMALHGGDVELRDNDYFGVPLNRVSRLRDAGHGQQIIATAQFRGYLTRPETDWQDHGRHRLRGLDEPEHIYQYLIEGLPTEFPLLRTESAHPHNLPSETTTFVGRRRDLLALRELLTEKQARLVTITGLGGSGKSRLAIRAASDLLWRFSEGIWYIDVDQLSHAEEFATALLSICGLDDNPRRTPLQQVCEHFRNAHALILIDGAEQFEDIADDIAALLKGTENLQILVASRNLLQLSMEHEYALDSMSTEESVALFVERGSQARLDFALTQENQAAIAAIGERLEGIPLSVELAAAQIRTLTPDEILEALRQRFAVLASRMRDLAPRHRSLRSTIDWSYQTLSPEEQRLFCSLSCFVGSFTLSAAEQICSELCAVEDVPATLTSLRAKSLLRQDSTADTRFMLQDSLREFGNEVLQNEQPTQRDQLRQRHGTYFRQVVLEEEPQLKGAQQKEALQRLERDAANIRMAMERFQNSEKPEEAARLAIGLLRFWEMRGWTREGRDRVQRLLRLENRILNPAVRAELLLTAGRLAWNGSAATEAIRYLERCVALCQKTAFDEAAKTESTALTVLGMIAYSRGELAEADRYYEAALPLKAQIGDHPGEAALRMNLGINAMTRGDNERAMSLFEEALAFRQQVGDMVREAHVWNCIGATAVAMGDPSRAVEAFQKSFEMCEQLGDHVYAAHARINLGDLALKAGNTTLAAEHYNFSLPTLRTAEDWRGITACLIGCTDVALFLEHWQESLRCAHEALAISRKNGYQENQAMVLERLARVAFETKDLPRATRYLSGAHTLRLEMGVDRTADPATPLDALYQQLAPLPLLQEHELPALLADAESYSRP